MEVSESGFVDICNNIAGSSGYRCFKTVRGRDAFAVIPALQRSQQSFCLSQEISVCITMTQMPL